MKISKNVQLLEICNLLETTGYLWHKISGKPIRMSIFGYGNQYLDADLILPRDIPRRSVNK